MPSPLVTSDRREASIFKTGECHHFRFWYEATQLMINVDGSAAAVNRLKRAGNKRESDTLRQQMLFAAGRNSEDWAFDMVVIAARRMT